MSSFGAFDGPEVAIVQFSGPQHRLVPPHTKKPHQRKPELTLREGDQIPTPWAQLEPWVMCTPVHFHRKILEVNRSVGFSSWLGGFTFRYLEA